MLSKYKSYLLVIIAVLFLIFAYKFLNGEKKTEITSENSQTEEENTVPSKTAGTVSKAKSSPVSKTNSVPSQPGTSAVSLPEIEFIDQRFIINLANYSGVKFTVEKVALGRGDSVVSTGCNSGIPNYNFATYLSMGESVCIAQSQVDGKSRAILAIHVLIENKGSYAFGGNENALKIYYTRADDQGIPRIRFAYPISGLSNHYIQGYSSKSVVLSYLVPEDQSVYSALIDYKEPAYDNPNKDVFWNSSNAFFIDFNKKSISLVK